VVASSIYGQAAIQLQGSLPFAFQVLGGTVPSRTKSAVLARKTGVLFPERQGQDWHSTASPGVLALHWRVRHAPGRSVVGASRRLKSQPLGAATEGSADLESVPRPRHIAQENARVSRLARSEAVPSAMPHYSIERTSHGLRPCAASHVKR
jgi:hypothetical protein